MGLPLSIKELLETEAATVRDHHLGTASSKVRSSLASSALLSPMAQVPWTSARASAKEPSASAPLQLAPSASPAPTSIDQGVPEPA